MNAVPWPTAVIDPHIHQWDPFTTPRHISMMAKVFAPLPRIPREMRWIVPQADREFIGNPHHVLKPYGPREYAADAVPVPVRSIVHVEAGWLAHDHADTVGETRWIASLPFGQKGAPHLGAIVVNADPRWSDIGSVLDQHLAASPLVRGVRLSGANHPDPGVRDFIDHPHIHSDADFVRGFSAVAERGLTFELWGFAHQIPDMTVLAREYPETTFVLDHYATPVGIFGPRGRFTGKTAADRARLLSQWKDDVAALASLPNVVAKHSGLGMPMLGGDPGRLFGDRDLARVSERCAPLIQGLQDAFGPQRTMWASNYPMDKPVHSMALSARMLIEVLGTSADPQMLFRDVAVRTYKIGA
ncbi:MAG: amidohydrolase family protein [Nocardiaceae bacterium]|nr:amidohydrolase family protein [Nocardiaceae bacterium]